MLKDHFHDDSVDKCQVIITMVMVLGTVPGLKPSHAKTINLFNKITRVLSTQGNIASVTATTSNSYTAISFEQSRHSHKPGIPIKKREFTSTVTFVSRHYFSKKGME
jgi:hypothetical protein